MLSTTYLNCRHTASLLPSALDDPYELMKLNHVSLGLSTLHEVSTDCHCIITCTSFFTM
jgi:hypothetical protein